MSTAADYEVVEFVEGLSLFGWGVVLVLRRGGVQLIGYLRTDDYDPRDPVSVVAARYPRGRMMRLAVELSQIDERELELLDGETALGIEVTRRPPHSQAHDVIVTGKVVGHLPSEDRVILDCGILLTTEWSDWKEPPALGRIARQSGDLWLHDASE